MNIKRLFGTKNKERFENLVNRHRDGDRTKLNEEISRLKYPGEERAKEKRVAIEITLE